MTTKPTEAELSKLKSDPGVISLYTDRVSLAREGKRLVGVCPFHPDRSPSFSVNQSGTGEWVWGCWSSCGSGNIFQFLEKKDGISFSAAVKLVREHLGAEQRTPWDQVKSEVDKIFSPLSGQKTYKTFPLARLKPLEDALAGSNPGAQRAQAWLKSRGLSLEIAQQMHLGFRQDISKTVTVKDGDKDIAAAGWMVFPSLDGDTVVSIKYRSLARKVFYRQPGMQTTLFGAQNVDMFSPIFVVEGEPDALVMQQAGYRAVSLPSASVTPTPEMRDLLMQADVRILAGDCDSGVGEEVMSKLWSELQEKTFLLKWPNGRKDANETFLKEADGDVARFRELVDGLVLEAMSKPAPFVTSLEEAMTGSGQTNLKDSPNRLRFPWPKVDEMAILLPGSVIGVMATQTGQGKTTFVHNATLYAARKHGEVVLNYQAELTPEEFVTITAAHILRKHRNHLTSEDMQRAKEQIAGIRYYIGRNPNLSTVEPTLDLIEDSVRRLGATVVVLDNLHFICRNEDNEIAAQANAMQRIKQMAQRYKLKFIVVGQPRKSKQENRGKQIHLTDWRGSATGVDDADALFILHREWLKDADPENPPMDKYNPFTTITREKARACGDGAAVASLMFLGAMATFSEPAREVEFELS